MDSFSNKPYAKVWVYLHNQPHKVSISDAYTFIKSKGFDPDDEKIISATVLDSYIEDGFVTDKTEVRFITGSIFQEQGRSIQKQVVIT